MSLFWQGLDERERGPADELPVLATGALVTAACLAQSDAEATGHLTQVRQDLRHSAPPHPWSDGGRIASMQSTRAPNIGWVHQMPL